MSIIKSHFWKSSLVDVTKGTHISLGLVTTFHMPKMSKHIVWIFRLCMKGNLSSFIHSFNTMLFKYAMICYSYFRRLIFEEIAKIITIQGYFKKLVSTDLI